MKKHSTLNQTIKISDNSSKFQIAALQDLISIGFVIENWDYTQDNGMEFFTEIKLVKKIYYN